MPVAIDSKIFHWAALEALEEADMLAAHSPDSAFDKEAVYKMSQVTPEWLTKVLGSKVPEAKLLETASVGGHEGMTSRHKWHLVWNEAGQKAGLPTDIFFKATPENAHLREMLSLLHMAERECQFYNHLQDDLSDLIPKCYYARSYSGGRHIVILEDIEMRGITPHWVADDCPISLAREVAVAQAKLHSRLWNSDRFERDLAWARPHCRRFGEPWQLEYFTNSRKKFLSTEIGTSLPGETQELVRAWDEHCVTVWEYFDSKPLTLVHGDSHIGNNLEFADKTVGFYDWQCFFRGYGYRDLSYFLASALTSEALIEHEKELFDLYTDTLEENGITIDREEAWKDFALLMMDGMDAAMSTLANGGYGHGISAVVRQVELMTAAGKRHNILDLIKSVVATGKV